MKAGAYLNQLLLVEICGGIVMRGFPSYSSFQIIIQLPPDIFSGTSLPSLSAILKDYHFERKFSLKCPTVCVTCVWAGVDSAWEQKKLEARKMLENAAESHTSGACFVRRLCERKTL